MFKKDRKKKADTSKKTKDRAASGGKRKSVARSDSGGERDSPQPTSAKKARGPDK